jgi:hypothetical protein
MRWFDLPGKHAALDYSQTKAGSVVSCDLDLIGGSDVEWIAVLKPCESRTAVRDCCC